MDVEDPWWCPPAVARGGRTRQIGLVAARRAFQATVAMAPGGSLPHSNCGEARGQGRPRVDRDRARTVGKWGEWQRQAPDAVTRSVRWMCNIRRPTRKPCRSGLHPRGMGRPRGDFTLPSTHWAIAESWNVAFALHAILRRSLRGRNGRASGNTRAHKTEVGESRKDPPPSLPRPAGAPALRHCSKALRNRGGASDSPDTLIRAGWGWCLASGQTQSGRMTKIDRQSAASSRPTAEKTRRVTHPLAWPLPPRDSGRMCPALY